MQIEDGVVVQREAKKYTQQPVLIWRLENYSSY